MSFGFSVGDFVAALQLVRQVVTALQESGGSGAEYRELIAELYGLERALLAVKQLGPELERDQQVEYLALNHVATLCQQTIDAFYKKIERYHRPFRNGHQGSSIQEILMKIQWSLCRKDDLLGFKADVSAHAQSIQILLSAAKVRQSKLQGQKTESYYAILAGAINTGSNQVLGKLTNLSEMAVQGTTQAMLLTQRITDVIRFNIYIYNMLCMIYKAVLNLPRQVEREHPVVMFDALGRIAPFHLEFVRSSEAFKAVLIANFRDTPSGMRKIENGDFLVQDTATKRTINLNGDWNRCFLPGQRVEMFMVFRWKATQAFQCPNCSLPSETLYNRDIECTRCGVIFGCFVEVSPSRQKASVDQHTTVTVALGPSPSRMADSKTHIVIRTPKTAYDEAEDIVHYRRVKTVRRISRKFWNQLLKKYQNCTDENEASREKSQGSSTMKNSSMVGFGNTEKYEIEERIQKLDPNVVDTQVFEQILEMDDNDDEIGREFSRSLVSNLFLDGEGRAKVIEESIFNGDLYVTETNAHAWKGHCYTLGIRHLGLLCEQMQIFARYARCNDLKAWHEDYRIDGHLTMDDAPEWLMKQLNLIKDENHRAEKTLKAFYRIKDWDALVL
ncbi:hypothetical protein F4859DRAFT_499353 [Xylaria cf. heliscus]|nr:hypothetical protein F4859DRAFT_499353 [Xylaria cf. heliscus]